jgi:uncharacterized membrane protein
MSPIIMMAQNRQSQPDRAQADSDYRTNIAAKQEIEELMERLMLKSVALYNRGEAEFIQPQKIRYRQLPVTVNL